MRLDVLKVKVLLAERRMTQADLAAECGVSPQNISRILTQGHCMPATAGRIAEGLGVHVSEIVVGGAPNA